MRETQFMDTDKPPDGGVDYFDRPDDGCRAILEARSGPWHLPMVCGRKRTLDPQGGRSSYCQHHLTIYTNQPKGIRRI